MRKILISPQDHKEWDIRIIDVESVNAKDGTAKYHTEGIKEAQYVYTAFLFPVEQEAKIRDIAARHWAKRQELNKVYAELYSVPRE